MTILKKSAIEILLMICPNNNVQKCHLITASKNVNYKEQVMISSIKSDMKCSMYQVTPNQCKNLYKKWFKKTYKLMLLQLRLQNIND